MQIISCIFFNTRVYSIINGESSVYANALYTRGGVRQKSPGDILFHLLATRCFQPPPVQRLELKSKTQKKTKKIPSSKPSAEFPMQNMGNLYAICLMAIRSTNIHRTHTHILLPYKTQWQ